MTPPIIVGLALRDDDAAPLALGRGLARLADAPLALATVLPREVPARFPTPEYAHAVQEQALDRLRTVARDLREHEGVTTHVVEGSRAGGLHDLAERLDAAAVVVGSTHRGAVGRLLIGDVGAGLMHGSACPVAIAPRDYAARAGALQMIGVAFDGTSESRVALDAGIGLARRAGGSVHAFTVLEPVEWAPSYTWPGPYPSQELDETRERWAQNTAAEALQAIPDGVLGASEVIRGPVRHSLADVSAELDLLACGSRGYGAVRQVAAGSVARGLAHEAACPLLVVPREPSPSASALWRPMNAIEAT
jgi:nucleotide-binding universal stress UspA family protein